MTTATEWRLEKIIKQVRYTSVVTNAHQFLKSLPPELGKSDFTRIQFVLSQLPEPELTTQGPLFDETPEDELLNHCKACKKTKPQFCIYHQLSRLMAKD